MNEMKAVLFFRTKENKKPSYWKVSYTKEIAVRHYANFSGLQRLLTGLNNTTQMCNILRCPGVNRSTVLCNDFSTSHGRIFALRTS